jgi:hypothetical protein
MMAGMRNPSHLHRRSALIAITAPLLCGCLPLPDSGPEPASNTDQERTDIQSDELKLVLDEVLAEGFRRGLNVELNGAWQVLHGVLAYGTECLVQTPAGEQRAVEYLLGGGKLAGFEPLPGDLLANGRRGVRFELEPASMSGQGHRDQWLAVLSQTGLPGETELRVGEQVHTFGDVVEQTMWDIPRNLEEEYSWTLIGLTAYRPTDLRWKARDGAQWSLARLVQAEVDSTLEDAACGGTHRLIGLAMTLDRHRKAGGATSGVWAAAEDRIGLAVDQSRQYQNGDGSFSTTYLHRYGWSPDLSDVLRTTGHVLEFLSLAVEPKVLSERWIESSVRRLCDVLQATIRLDLECGALYHALHGLVLYRDRRFGGQLSF